jgi:hypothetical protein
MIRVTRQIKCLIAQAPGVIPHPLTEVNFLMVERGSLPLKSSLQVRGGVRPWDLSYNAFNLPSHPDHKYIWFKGEDLNH